MFKHWLIIFLLAEIVCVAQTAKKSGAKTIRIVYADSWSFDREKTNAQVLRGNVQCEHEGTLLHCDTALIYEAENTMVASGHILITKGDSIRITGEKLDYDGKTRVATLRNNVRCVENDMVLTTDILTFDMKHSV